jgi:hypothetical protein
MFEALGDVMAQAVPRPAPVHSGPEREVVVQRIEQARESRPIEHSEGGDRSKPETRPEEDGRTRNRLEDGKIIVETYDEYGKLIKKTPPGYLPFGETA